MKKFNSKRNNVYLRDGMVFKELKSPDIANSEAEFLTLLLRKGVAVPKVIRVDGCTLCMEHITGSPLPDFLMEHDAYERCRNVADNLAQWLEMFYTAVDNSKTSEIRGDVNGRNFIVTDSGIVGVDFEEHIFGHQKTDFGRLLAYIATYSYEDDRAQKVQREMVKMLTDSISKRFSLSDDVLSAEVANGLLEIESRRK